MQVLKYMGNFYIERECTHINRNCGTKERVLLKRGHVEADFDNEGVTHLGRISLFPYSWYSKTANLLKEWDYKKFDYYQAG